MLLEDREMEIIVTIDTLMRNYYQGSYKDEDT